MDFTFRLRESRVWIGPWARCHISGPGLLLKKRLGAEAILLISPGAGHARAKTLRERGMRHGESRLTPPKENILRLAQGCDMWSRGRGPSAQ
eukprot:6814550-Pyramimonas_sp.AAC.1